LAAIARRVQPAKARYFEDVKRFCERVRTRHIQLACY